MSENVMDPFDKAIKDPGQYAAEWTHKTGRKAVGVFPNYFPVELLDAAGILAVGLWGHEGPVGKADAHLQPFICTLLKSNFELALDGKLAALSGAVFPKICDSVQNSEGIWKRLFPDQFTARYRISQSPESQGAPAFMREEIDRLVEEIQTYFGVEIHPFDLTEAIIRRNRVRSMVRQISERFYGGNLPITAKDYFWMIKAAHIMDPDDWMPAAGQVLGTPPSMEFGGTRVMLSGMTCEPWWILETLERIDASVVADDLAFAGRAFAKDVDDQGDPFDALAKYTLDLNPCGNLHFQNKDRGDWLVEQAKKAKASGVIFTRLKFCDPEAFDHVYLKEKLDAAKIPSLLIESELSGSDVGSAQTRIEAFIETLETGDAS